MLLTKKGLPDDGELLLCTVNQIQANSVFVKVDEYGNASGMIHISEISPGRIRNIRDFVKEGKKIVCVVLKVNRERGHIDLSLRRVNETQKKKKIEYIKAEQKAEKIVEYVAGQTKLPMDTIYKEIREKTGKDYLDLTTFFASIVMDGVTLADYQINGAYAKQLDEAIRQRIKAPEVEINGEFKIECFRPNGVEEIKLAFGKIDKAKVTTSYLGAGKYHVHIKSSTYKEAEELLEESKTKITSSFDDENTSIVFNRTDKGFKNKVASK